MAVIEAVTVTQTVTEVTTTVDTAIMVIMDMVIMGMAVTVMVVDTETGAETTVAMDFAIIGVEVDSLEALDMVIMATGLEVGVVMETEDITEMSDMGADVCAAGHRYRHACQERGEGRQGRLYILFHFLRLKLKPDMPKG